MSKKIKLHYIQEENLSYTDWGLYIWGAGYDQKKIEWGCPLSVSGIDEYGPYWTIPYSGKGKIEFLIHNDQQRISDLGGEIEPDGEKNLWLVAEEQEIYTSQQEALAVSSLQELPAIPDNYVRLYYYRDDQDYEEWYLNYWREDPETEETLEEGRIKIRLGNVGGYWDIPCLSRQDNLKFIVERGEETEFDGEQLYPLAKANNQLWMVTGTTEKYHDSFPVLKEKENQIQEAVIINNYQIRIRCEEPVEKPIEIMLGSRSLPLSQLEEHQAPTYYLTTQQPLDYEAMYKVKAGNQEIKPVLAPEIIEENYVTDEELGAFYSLEQTTFKLWAPSASAVKLKLYKESFAEEPYQVIPLSRQEQGVWKVEVDQDLAGQFYRYELINGQIQEALDPYAKSMASFDIKQDRLGKGSIVDLEQTDPEGWGQDDYIEIENQEDVIIYEMSVRDFTIADNSGVEKEKRGTYLGFIDKISHLKELGVTHVQLMPVMNFYFGDESKKEFEDIGDDVNGNYNYNWGYDPHNYFSPEGWYATDSFDPQVRITELKKLIKALHEAGLGVILDVVYNHTAITEIFENVVPYYYYRRHEDGSLTNGSGCGNDTASERQMMRKLILDSVTYWTEEYHVDGFRFDLMSLHDETTMNQVKEKVRAINPHAVIHGEGWNLGTLPSEQKFVKADGHERSLLKVDNGPAVFNDGIRDAIKQGHFGSSLEEGGFVQQDDNDKPLIRAGIIAGMVDFAGQAAITEDPYHRFTDEPSEVINYVSCHDGYTLWDKIVKSTPHASEAERKRMDKLAMSIILTAQGKPFIHGGVEMLRTKPNPERGEGVDPNSYNSSDFTNQIDWSRKEKYKDIFQYYQGLTELRKEHKVFRLETMEQIESGLDFLTPGIDYVVGFRLTHPQDKWEEVLVIHNANREQQIISVPEINEDWQVVVDGEQAGVKTLTDTEVEVRNGEVVVPPIACVVLHK